MFDRENIRTFRKIMNSRSRDQAKTVRKVHGGSYAPSCIVEYVT